MARDERIRDLRARARRETGKDPVASMIVAFGLFGGGDGDGELRWDIRIDDRRWSEIWGL